ncbi:ATP-binding cassette domain-containing protein [Tissierella sp. Yu-01]|uniref:ABC transporter ATP-binding protein n=1 Tax=Tissierella sp. Yu-01 TaxID=3035694 RepID=UPI00240E90C0|nr:ATP-binding cassette domain-containing protein [Tissierella sp. Yu-01]WFA07981.1 ATP-binding cassette domain-containing protein [Tissierella sp. Yu-01]
MLEIKHIYKTFNEGTVNESKLFEDFNLKVNKGDFVSIIGNNGSGKTSLINIICGSMEVDQGQVLIEGLDITKKKDFIRYGKIGRVYQDPSMGTCTEMTILENISLADNKGKIYNLSRGTSRNRIDYYKESLKQLNLDLENKLNTKVGELSGGQRQAMALLMATMSPIEFLILDEHTAALDPKTADNIMELTNKIIQKKNNITTIMVTHNIRYALDYGNRIIMMSQGEIALDKSDDDKNNLTIQRVLSIY